MHAGNRSAWDDSVPLQGRTPVLAVGSNQSPEQIARKFPHRSDGIVPVMRVKLTGFDSVYSAHITQYASIPATLVAAPAVTVDLCVTWLTENQLTTMHSTEIPGENYRFARLENLECTSDHGTQLRSVCAYISSRGHIVAIGNPVPLAEISATNRRWSAKSQPDMQDWVAAQLTPHLTTDAFIDANLQDPNVRIARMKAMLPHAEPFDHQPMKFVAT